ncbi:tRNA synthetases class II-domain-containing protein [Whalleya microplaca]|nr:tRNA synthetases class II-domain-containing protein [Whalleya microplaca]
MTRLLSNSLPRSALRCITSIERRSLRLSLPRHPPFNPLFQQLRKTIHDDASAPTGPQDGSASADPDPRWDALVNSFYFAKQTPPWHYKPGKSVQVHGFLEKRRDKSSSLSFCNIRTNFTGTGVQIVSSWKEEGSVQHTAHQDLKSIPTYSPVVVEGTLSQREQTAVIPNGPTAKAIQQWDLQLQGIKCLNSFPKDIIVSKDTVWPPKSRHLQFRFDSLLQDRLRLRSAMKQRLRDALHFRRFMEFETPILFKSTPEGAREFLVPTRRQGYAYALPQSPQQYKQILMAGGFDKYYQFAKCFRDEDHRADRQPEFTQLDLEMAFSSGENVMTLVEIVVKDLFDYLSRSYFPLNVNGIRHPVWRSEFGNEQLKDKKKRLPKRKKIPDQVPFFQNKNISENENIPEDETPSYSPIPRPFRRLSYENAMSNFGSDKPDLRINSHASHITRIDSFLSEDFIKMITNLENPIVEAWYIRLEGATSENRDFIHTFMDSLPKTPIKLSPECTPGVFVFDSSKPLNGLSSLGHEAAQQLASIEKPTWKQCQDGDVIIIQARKNEPFQGGSTDLGKLRTAIYESAVNKGLLPKDHSFQFLWVNEFPLFTSTDDGPGQGGAAGFSSTHHPFTAPLSPEDFKLLKTDPLKAKADHYDLVLNGVELGGGSRRIHVAEVQEYVMRDILKMADEGVSQFSHLLEALRAGCPPHAGFAFGFDRLMAVICDVPSIRDVVAFPKSNKGEDLLVGSPSMTTRGQQKTYHLEQR